MSYPNAGVTDVINDIKHDPLVKGVEAAKFWQAHYGVGLANLRLRIADVCGEEAALIRLRERIVGLIRNRLSGGYGSSGAAQKWEVSIEFQVDGSESMGVSQSLRPRHDHTHSHHLHSIGHL